MTDREYVGATIKRMLDCVRGPGTPDDEREALELDISAAIYVAATLILLWKGFRPSDEPIRRMCIAMANAAGFKQDPEAN